MSANLCPHHWLSLLLLNTLLPTHPAKHHIFPLQMVSLARCNKLSIRGLQCILLHTMLIKLLRCIRLSASCAIHQSLVILLTLPSSHLSVLIFEEFHCWQNWQNWHPPTVSIAYWMARRSVCYRHSLVAINQSIIFGIADGLLQFIYAL